MTETLLSHSLCLERGRQTCWLVNVAAERFCHSIERYSQRAGVGKRAQFFCIYFHVLFDQFLVKVFIEFLSLALFLSLRAFTLQQANTDNDF